MAWPTVVTAGLLDWAEAVGPVPVESPARMMAARESLNARMNSPFENALLKMDAPLLSKVSKDPRSFAARPYEPVRNESVHKSTIRSVGRYLGPDGENGFYVP